MAEEQGKLDVPIHTDIGLLDECRRRLLLQTRLPEAQERHLQFT